MNSIRGIKTFVIASCALAALQAAPVSADNGKATRCEPVRLKVALAPQQPKQHSIAGTLCSPRGHQHRTVDVLVHGATYNGGYWNFPVDYPQYSYVQRTLAAKQRSVFYYDRLGTGRSSRPHSAEVTMDADAYVLHQIISWLDRDKRYREIDVIGHSFGSLLAVQTAAQYGGIDRLVLTGSLRSTGPALINGELVQYPAEQDPQFAGKGYDEGWLTSAPGARAPFYDVVAADPDVIAFDEAHKDVASSTQLAQGRAQRTAPPASNISNQVRDIPVLIIAGQNDRLYCNVQVDCSEVEAVRVFETPYYTNVRSLDVITVPHTGHDIALHPSAEESFQHIDRWLRATPARRR